jgi:hypothetical protein
MTATAEFADVQAIEHEIQTLMMQAAEEQFSGRPVGGLLLRVEELSKRLVELTTPKLAA